MDRRSIVKTACHDELVKISHFIRSGRRPISVDRLLEREAENPASLDAVIGQTDESSEGEEKTANAVGKTLATMGAGALGYHMVRQANEDRKLGKQIRVQQS